jgi:hypothetical protein
LAGACLADAVADVAAAVKPQPREAIADERHGALIDELARSVPHRQLLPR